MRRRTVLIASGAFAAAALLATAAVRSNDAKPAAALPPVSTPAAVATVAPASPHRGTFDGDVTPLLQRYCYECHGDGASAGELALDEFKTLADATAPDAKDHWQQVIRYVRTQVMPPPEAEHKIAPAQREQLVRAIQKHVYGVDSDKPDPGRVAIRRLNRIEYRNTIRDLTGVAFDPTIDFPQDDTGYGFDTIADVLTLPPMLMEKYLAAAEKVLDDAIPTARTEPKQRRIAAADARASFDRRDERIAPDGTIPLFSEQEDALSVTNESPAPAEYVVRVMACVEPVRKRRDDDGDGERGAGAAGGRREDAPPAPKLSILINDAVAREIEVTAAFAEPQWYEARVGMPQGRNTVRAAVLRQRGPVADRTVSAGRVGVEQQNGVRVTAMQIEGPVGGAVRRISGDRVEISGEAAGRRDGGTTALHRSGDAGTIAIDVPATGLHALRVQAYSDFAGDEPAKMELLLDNKPLRTFDVTAPSYVKPSAATKDLSDRARRAVPRVYEVQTRLTAGKHRLTARYANNFKDDANPDPNFRDRNLYISYFEVVDLSAPPGSRPMTAPMRSLFAKYPTTAPSNPSKDADAARSMLGEFAQRAWRRPLDDEELDRLAQLYTLARDNGEAHREAARHAIKAVLVSPSFLFRGELTPTTPTDKPAGNATANNAYPVGEYELASRLSYFLWSTTPDDILLELARRGELRKSLPAQVKRMLASDRSKALVENFAGQWLQFRNLDAVHPDRRRFEEYDDRLRDAMQRETQLFFESIVREDRSLIDVLTADYTFVNERLARHYGLSNVSGQDFRRVSLTGTPRRGVLTQGSVLTLTSNPTRTSPVKRGKWVLENLLGTAPPPPPPEVPSIDSPAARQKGATIRERLEIHREDPTCASCHAPMDPIGFGLENFDAIGRFREKDGSDPIDASAEFVDGKKFTGPAELVAILAEDRRSDFYRAAAEACLTFALGRGVEPFDQPAVDRIVDDLYKNNGRFSTLVMGVVNSVPFQMRRADEAKTRMEDGG